MRNLKTLFLFFYVVLSTLSVVAQKKIDSLVYYSGIIDNPDKKSELVSAYIFFSSYINKALLKNDEHKIIYGYTNMALIEKELGELYNSESSAIEALKLLDKMKTSVWTENSRSTIYNHLGIISKKQLNFEKALEYYKMALEKLNQPINRARIYGNIGNILRETHEHELAIENYEIALKICSKINSPKLKARLLGNLGLAQSKLNRQGALNNMLEALEIRKKIKSSQGVITSYLNLAEYYLEKDSVNKAKFYSERALNIADSTNIMDHKIASLSSVLKLSDNFRVKEFIKINDSLKIAELINSKKYSAAKYNIKEKEKDLQKSKTREERLTFGLAFLFTAVVFLYFLLKSKYKKQKLQEVYNTETRISKQVHDEVANDMYQVMTKLQSSNHIKEEVLDDMESIYMRTRDISNENSAINLNDTFENILSDLLLSYKNDTITIITKGLSKMDWKAVSKIKKTMIYRVLQELMVNMKKHSEATFVVIKFSKEHRKVIIEYKDNGIGKSFKKGNGLTNAENRIQSINGTFTFESENNKGFTAKIIV